MHIRFSSTIPNKTDVAFRINSYINEYIRFADAKAGIVVTFMSALLWALFDRYHETPCANAYTIAVSIVLALTAVVVALGVIWPYTPKPPKGYIFWESIYDHKEADIYAEAFAGLSPTQFLSALSVQNFFIAKVAVRKYKWFRAAFGLGVLAAALGLVALSEVGAVERVVALLRT